MESRRGRLAASALRLLAPVVLLALAFFARDLFLGALQRISGFEFVHAALWLRATLLVRALSGLMFAGLLGAALWLGLRISIAWGLALPAALAMAVVAGVQFRQTGRFHWTGGLFTSAVFVLNSIPPALLLAALTHRIARWPISAALLAGIGFAELLLPRVYYAWMRNRLIPGAGADPLRWSSFLPGITAACLAFALLLPPEPLLRLSDILFRDPRVTRLLGKSFYPDPSMDVTWLGVDPEHNRLYACGDGLDGIHQYALPTMELLAVSESNTGAQFCHYEPELGELYTYDSKRNQLLWIEADALQVIRRQSLVLPRGEVFLGRERTTDALVAMSEALTPTAFTGAVVERATGKLRLPLHMIAGYMLVHPGEPSAYTADFLGRTDEIQKVDLRTGSVVARASGAKYVDRLVFDETRNEVLAAVPAKGLILRFDAATLEAKRPVRVAFGVRSMTIDRERDLLLTANFVTWRLDVYDLRDHRRLQRFRVAPWLRDIALEPERGIAYVSSRYGVYRLNYASSVGSVAGAASAATDHPSSPLATASCCSDAGPPADLDLDSAVSFR